MGNYTALDGIAIITEIILMAAIMYSQPKLGRILECGMSLLMGMFIWAHMYVVEASFMRREVVMQCMLIVFCTGVVALTTELVYKTIVCVGKFLRKK